MLKAEGSVQNFPKMVFEEIGSWRRPRFLNIGRTPMTRQQKDTVRAAHFNLPADCRSKPATNEELECFEREFGTIPEDFRWYLGECGGGVIGSEWIDNIRQLHATHKKVKVGQQRGFYKVARFFPLGWDGYGNPYGYDLDTGRIVMEDHNFGGIQRVAADFYDLLSRKGLIK